jgi:hypothetical protein
MAFFVLVGIFSQARHPKHILWNCDAMRSPIDRLGRALDVKSVLQ